MIPALQKIVDRLQATDQTAQPSPSSLFASASRPFAGSPTPLPEQAMEDIALWKALGSGHEASNRLIKQDAALQLHTALGAIAWESRRLPKGQIVQVQARNRLIALLDSRSMQAHVRPDAYPGDADELISLATTAQRIHFPEAFHVVALWDLIWHFGYQHPIAWRQVPLEVAHSSLKLRRLPLTSMQLLPDAAMPIIGILVHGNANFAQLCSTSKLPAEEVLRCLVALYITRSVQIAGKQASNDSTS